MCICAIAAGALIAALADNPPDARAEARDACDERSASAEGATRQVSRGGSPSGGMGGREAPHHNKSASPSAHATPEESGSQVQQVSFEPMVLIDGSHDALGERFRGGMPITGATPHRLILFTFDDGPDPVHTPRLLDSLDEAGVKAVFFLTANRIRGENEWERRLQELAREIVRRGHLIGNHTLDHAQLPMLSDAEVRRQLVEAEGIFEDVLGARPYLFRPPGGARSERVDAIVAERGYTTVVWNLGSGDFLVETPNQVFGTWRRVFERRMADEGDRGGIILLHDIQPHAVDAFPQIVEWLRRENCELLARGEELYDIVDDPALFFVPRADAPPSLDAAPAMPDPAILAARQERLRVETSRICPVLAQR